jgi:DNA polymerase elongation subunit (family B)
MKEEEIQKMLIELRDKRKSNRSTTLTSVRPTGSASMISSGVVSMDFASLYPSTMTMKFPSKQSRRMKKIKNIFK